MRVCVVVADLLLISSAEAARLRRRIAKAVGIPASNVIVAATHTHSGPLVDTEPFRLSRGDADVRVRQFMRELDEIFVRTAVAAREKLQPVRASYSRAPIHGLATDRNEPENNRVQPFILVRLEGRRKRRRFRGPALSSDDPRISQSLLLRRFAWGDRATL